MPDTGLALAASADEERVALALVDGTTLFREGILRILSGTRFRVACHVDSVSELVRRLRVSDGASVAPGPGASARLALVSLPEGGGEAVEDLARLHADRPDLSIVVLADSFDAECLRRCFRAGVDGYLLKSISSGALLNSLELVALGEKVFPRQLVDLLSPIGGRADTAAPHRDLGRLSERETEILRCLVAGHSNKVIAGMLEITEATVKVHLKSILRKIGATNRTQAAIWGLNNGVQPLDRAA